LLVGIPAKPLPWFATFLQRVREISESENVAITVQFVEGLEAEKTSKINRRKFAMIQCDKMTTVYRNLKTGAYFVQPDTVGPVAATEFGDPTTIQTSEFEAKIADAIMENLDKFGREQYDKVLANPQ
jgi:hypothetical protein